MPGEPLTYVWGEHTSKEREKECLRANTWLTRGNNVWYTMGGFLSEGGHEVSQMSDLLGGMRCLFILAIHPRREFLP